MGSERGGGCGGEQRCTERGQEMSGHAAGIGSKPREASSGSGCYALEFVVKRALGGAQFSAGLKPQEEAFGHTEIPRKPRVQFAVDAGVAVNHGL